MAVKHASTMPGADGADTTVVRPSDWTANHGLTGAFITAPMLDRFARGLERLGYTQLGTAATSMSVSNLVPRDLLTVIITVPSTSVADRIKLTLNGDTGANYWCRNVKSVLGTIIFTDGPTSTTPVGGANQTGILLHFDTETTERFVMVNLANRLAISKTIQAFPFVGSNSAATAADLEACQGEWINTTSQITSVTVATQGGTATMPIGSGMTVLGKDTP